MRRPNAITLYVSLVVILGGVALRLEDWSTVLKMSLADYTGWLVLLTLGIISESLAVPIAIERTRKSTSSIVFIPQLATLLLFGPAATVLFMLVVGVTGEFLFRRKPPKRALFNSAQYVLSTFLAGKAFTLLGGQPLLLRSPNVRAFEAQLLGFVGFCVTFVIINNFAVSSAIVLSEKSSFRSVWSKVIGRSGTNLFYDLLISPIAFGVAGLYLLIPMFGPLLALLPLLFIRSSYLTIQQLQQLNRDLLKALVKAIETRDPYTSGHSMRVQALACRIADALKLPRKIRDEVEQASLLHDIGKIEVPYAEVLRKPSNLTDAERKTMESHVAKGVELLEQLSSMPRGVIDAVGAHHERVDGKGYPQGLEGEQIPLAARIIKICDAIDAMLSDRPYRRALSVDQAREELLRFAGSQFDPQIVDVVIREKLLESHYQDCLRQKGDQGQIGDTNTIYMSLGISNVPEDNSSSEDNQTENNTTNEQDQKRVLSRIAFER